MEKSSIFISLIGCLYVLIHTFFQGMHFKKLEQLLFDMRSINVNGITAWNKDDVNCQNLMKSKAFKTPSCHTLKELFIHFYSRKKIHLENEMLSHRCSWLSWDHTFWVAKIIHCEKQSPFKGYFICMNQVKSLGTIHIFLSNVCVGGYFHDNLISLISLT